MANDSLHNGLIKHHVPRLLCLVTGSCKKLLMGWGMCVVMTGLIPVTPFYDPGAGDNKLQLGHSVICHQGDILVTTQP